MQNKQLGGLASGVSSNDIYKKSIKGDLDGNKRLAPVEPFRCLVEQMRYLQEQGRGYALGSDALNYAVPTENNAIGTTDAEISNTKEGFADLLNTIIAHNNLLKVNTNSSTSSAWVLEREAYMNDAPDAPDGENYSFGNIAFAIFGYDKTFTVISPYDVTEAALAITLPAMDNVSGQIAVERPDGTGFVSLQQNKRYYFRTYFDGTTPKIVLENSEPVTTTASETVAGSIKISTSEQVTAGTDDTSAMTPAKLFEKLSAVKEVTTITSTTDVNGAVVKNGYTITRDISTGAIIGKKVFGWVKTISPDNGVNQVFPIAFTALYSANCCIANASPNNDATPDQPVHITSLSLTGLRVSNSSANAIDASYVIKGI